MRENPVGTRMRGRIPTYITGLGVVLGLGLLVESLIAVLGPATDAVFPARLLTSAPFVGGLIYGGYWLARSDLSAERYPRIGWWSVGGLMGFLFVNAAVMLAVPPANGLVAFGWVRWALSLGASVGLLIGVFEARAIHREIVAERARVRFERTESRRELLGYLNRLLGDEIAPGVDAVAERATRLTEAADLQGDAADHAAAIRRRTRTLQALINHTADLLDRDEDAVGLEPVNLAAVLREEIATVRTDAPTAEIEAGIAADDEWYVLADRLLPRVFGELLSYVLERNDLPTPRVSLEVETTLRTVTVRITDNGPALPARECDGLFEYGDEADDSASELAFVGMLMEYYGGSIGLEETGPDGNVFTVELRRVTVDTESSQSPRKRPPVPSA